MRYFFLMIQISRRAASLMNCDTAALANLMKMSEHMETSMGRTLAQRRQSFVEQYVEKTLFGMRHFQEQSLH